MGQSDLPNVKTVKLYCAKCEDIYNPKSTRHASIDGAYFGTSFHNILFQVYPALIPEKSIRRYEPRIYGFKVHACAALARWQDARREDMKERLTMAGVDAGFVEDSEREDDDEVDEEDDKSLVAEPVEGSAIAGVATKTAPRAAGDGARMDTGA
jgi:casein kinase II subunit beta